MLKVVPLAQTTAAIETFDPWSFCRLAAAHRAARQKKGRHHPMPARLLLVVVN
jgi:hypothetical protein